MEFQTFFVRTSSEIDQFLLNNLSKLFSSCIFKLRAEITQYGEDLPFQL